MRYICFIRSKNEDSATMIALCVTVAPGGTRQFDADDLTRTNLTRAT